MPLFPNDVERSDTNRRGGFHFHPVARTTLSRLLGHTYYTGECPLPPREPGTTFFKTTISPSTARTWKQQTMFQRSHKECQKYHRIHIFRIPLAEARMMRLHSYYQSVAPDADTGFIYVGLCPDRGTTIMVDLAGNNISYRFPSLGNHVQLVTGGSGSCYYVAAYVRAVDRLDLVVIRFEINGDEVTSMVGHLYNGSKEFTLKQRIGDGGCDVTRLSFVADPCREQYFSDLQRALSSYAIIPVELSQDLRCEQWLSFDERPRDQRSKFPEVRSDELCQLSSITIGFTFAEVTQTHPWHFNTADECLRRMHESERVVSDCPLVGVPFCQVELQHPRATVPHRVEIILSSSDLFGFYKRTDRYAGRFALSHDPDFDNVRQERLNEVYNLSNGIYDQRLNPARFAPSLVDYSFDLNFVRDLARNPKKPQPNLWAPGVKYRKEYFHNNPQRDADGRRYSDYGIDSCDSDCQFLAGGNAPPRRPLDQVSIPGYVPINHHHDHREETRRDVPNPPANLRSSALPLSPRFPQIDPSVDNSSFGSGRRRRRNRGRKHRAQSPGSPSFNPMLAEQPPHSTSSPRSEKPRVPEPSERRFDRPLEEERNTREVFYSDSIRNRSERCAEPNQRKRSVIHDQAELAALHGDLASREPPRKCSRPTRSDRFAPPQDPDQLFAPISAEGALNLSKHTIVLHDRVFNQYEIAHKQQVEICRLFSQLKELRDHVMQRLPTDSNFPGSFPVPLNDNHSATGSRARGRSRNPVPNHWERSVNNWGGDEHPPAGETAWATPAPEVESSPWAVPSSIAEEAPLVGESQEVENNPPPVVDSPPVLSLQVEVPERSSTEIVPCPQSDEHSSVIIVDPSNLTSPMTEEEVTDASRHAPRATDGTVTAQAVCLEKSSGEIHLRVESKSPPSKN